MKKYLKNSICNFKVLFKTDYKKKKNIFSACFFTHTITWALYGDMLPVTSATTTKFFQWEFRLKALKTEVSLYRDCK